VPRSRETTAEHVIEAVVAGALGTGLRIRERDREGIHFEATTFGAIVSGPWWGHLRVRSEERGTVVYFQFSALPAVAFALIPAVLVGLVSWSTIDALSEGLAHEVGLVNGLLAGVGWGLWAVGRSRERFETLLHNLRYLS